MTSPEPLLEDLRARAFRPRAGSGRRAIGAEVEFLPVVAATGRRAPVEAGPERPATLTALRRHAPALEWREGRSDKGTPYFELPHGGRVTFEPGGQLEYASPPIASGSGLVRRLEATSRALHEALGEEGIELVTLGIDPERSLAEVPLMLSSDRYCRMGDYFASIGPAGVRMMRQTASVQVALDFGAEPGRRWRLLNAAAPYLTALFANSPCYEGRATGCQSYRAETWRTLDPARTGLFDAEGGDPAEGYHAFALAAPAMLLGAVDGRYAPFGEWWRSGRATPADWDLHLSTLFPEVRPRGYLEVRSMDALPPEAYAIPVALLSGLVYDGASLGAALDLLGRPDPSLLGRAAASGLQDPGIARVARDLMRIGLAGARRLGPLFFDEADLATAEEFAAERTEHALSPADLPFGDAALGLPR